VGTTASSTTDYGLITYQEKYPNVGVHASMANQLLSREFVDDAPWWVSIVIALIVCYFYVFICFKIKTPGRKLLLGLAVLIVAVGGILAAFIITKTYFGAAVPMIAMGVTFVVMTSISLISTTKEKKFIQDKFGAYVAPEIVDELVKHPENAKVGGDSKHITALFSDVKTFSGFTETVNNVATQSVREHNQDIRDGKFPMEDVLSDDEVAMRGAAKGAEKLVAYLNDYLGALSDAIMKEHGTIDKYVGDEIVSFFGAPIDNPNNAFDSCIAAIRMKQVEEEFNREHEKELPIHPITKTPYLLKSRVGLNTGDMVVGNMGTEQKLNYTVMGNNVNLASRLEGTNKAYDSWIIASESTWNEANSGENEGKLVAKMLDCVKVINVEKPVQIYSIQGLKGEISSAQVEGTALFNKGMEWYLKGRETPNGEKDLEDFIKAKHYFEEAWNCYHTEEVQDKSYITTEKKMIARCDAFLKDGLPKDANGIVLPWDGVYTMKSK
ncbi:MAG: hypothetical protein J6W60_13815, partial [Treponema sp.]|nr:hypothetical protein [Treponema sp.]